VFDNAERGREGQTEKERGKNEKERYRDKDPFSSQNVYDAALVAALADRAGIAREAFQRVLLSVDKDSQGNLDFSDVIVIARTESTQLQADLALNLRGVVFGGNLFSVVHSNPSVDLASGDRVVQTNNATSLPNQGT
jgi:hypothetical protein